MGTVQAEPQLVHVRAQVRTAREAGRAPAAGDQVVGDHGPADEVGLVARGFHHLSAPLVPEHDRVASLVGHGAVDDVEIGRAAGAVADLDEDGEVNPMLGRHVEDLLGRVGLIRSPGTRLRVGRLRR